MVDEVEAMYAETARETGLAAMSPAVRSAMHKSGTASSIRPSRHPPIATIRCRSATVRRSPSPTSSPFRPIC
jgi:hypothetical protein